MYFFNNSQGSQGENPPDYSVMNKEEIRRKILKKRLSLSSEDIRDKSQQVFLNLAESVEYINSRNIMFYVATRSEVQTEEVIKMSIKMGKNVFIPIILPEYLNLAPSRIFDFDIELEKGKKGILEPKKEYYRLFPSENIDLIIVPGVAFVVIGATIWRGVGFLDNIFSKFND